MLRAAAPTVVYVINEEKGYNIGYRSKNIKFCVKMHSNQVINLEKKKEY